MRILRLPPVTFPCSGTPLHLTSPNDFTNAAWANQNMSVPANVVSDPFFVANNAGQFTASATNFCHVAQSVTISEGVTYSITGYMKYISGPQFVLIGLGDPVSFGNGFALAHFDFQNGVVSQTESGNGGTFVCAQIISAGNGYFQFSISGSIASPIAPVVILRPTTLGDGTNDQATSGQQFNYYTVGP